MAVDGAAGCAEVHLAELGWAWDVDGIGGGDCVDYGVGGCGSGGIEGLNDGCGNLLGGGYVDFLAAGDGDCSSDGRVGGDGLGDDGGGYGRGLEDCGGDDGESCGDGLLGDSDA